MICLHSHKLIFVKTQKTAGTSFEMALAAFANKEDVITPIRAIEEKQKAIAGLPTGQNFTLDHTSQALSAYNHMTTEEIHDFVGSLKFSEYKKITIHRDPLDFLVSLYFWRQRHRKKRLNFKAWLERNAHLCLTNYTIAPIAGPLKVDVALRYHKLQEDISKTAFLPEGFLAYFQKTSAKSGIRPKSSVNALDFFIENNCEQEIQQIFQLMETNIPGFVRQN